MLDFPLRAPRVSQLAVLGSFLVLPAAAAGSSLSVYERMAQAELVVRVRTIDGSLRLAQCRVLEVLKGQYNRSDVYVAFRADNMSRQNWDDRIAFEDDQESVLLLEPSRGADGEVRAPDRFELVGAHLGKIDLPREGAEAYIQAFRRLGQILSLSDIHQVWDAYRGLILEVNPYLIETGFAEILKFRLGDATMIPVLLDHLESRHDPFRASSLKVLAQIFETSHRRSDPLGNEAHVVARVLAAAVEDPRTEVRVEAVKALEVYGGAEVIPALRRLAREDRSQDVRYQAALSVYHLARGASTGHTSRTD